MPEAVPGNGNWGGAGGGREMAMIRSLSKVEVIKINSRIKEQKI